ncbi:hypothetical protein AB0H12_43165 [Actinosynnema sp. NPDC023794]
MAHPLGVGGIPGVKADTPRWLAAPVVEHRAELRGVGHQSVILVIWVVEPSTRGQSAARASRERIAFA